jgi:hypothetical protein
MASDQIYRTLPEVWCYSKSDININRAFSLEKWNHEYDSISQANTLRLAALTMRNHSLSRRLRHYKVKLSKARLELAHSRREKVGINISRRRTGKLRDSRFEYEGNMLISFAGREYRC